jgi:hypothetical protein
MRLKVHQRRKVAAGPQKNFKLTDKSIFDQHDLSVPVNFVTGKKLSLEALVSGFDINVGMGGVSFLRDAQGNYWLMMFSFIPTVALSCWIANAQNSQLPLPCSLIDPPS